MALSVSKALQTLTATPGLVVLMCGLAGSGKTTVSKALGAKGFIRLSIDEDLWEASGRYGVDFGAEDYPQHLEAARGRMRRRLIEAMERRAPAVVDSAFWSRASRDEYRSLIEQHGCACRLIYLKTPPDLLRRRLAERNQRVDANAQFPVTEEVLGRFIQSFEEPDGEGEIVVTAS